METKNSTHEIAHEYEDIPASTEGRLIQHDLSLSLAEAWYGCRKEILIEGRQVRIQIPAKTADAGRTTQSGVCFWISVEKQEGYRYEGGQLQIDVPLDITTASLGGSTQVLLPKGIKKTIPVSPQTQDGQILSQDEIHFRFTLQVPIQLNPRQKKLLQELEKS